MLKAKYLITSFVIVSFILLSILFTTTNAALTKVNNAANITTTNEDGKKQKDAETLGWLITLDNNEIAAGKLAVSKRLNSKVNAYAELMIKAHSENLNKTKKLSKDQHVLPIYSLDTKALKEKGKKELNVLKPLTGIHFEKAYMGAMVNGHTEALTEIDKYLSNVGTNMKLESHLKATKGHIEHHLEKAKEIQNSM